MINKSKIIWIAIAVIVIAGVLINQTNKKDEPTSLTIGMISILSGDYSAVGENFRNGAILAVEQHNEANPEQQITLVVEDDGFDTKKALSAYQKLTGINDIDALINVSTVSIAAIYDRVTQTSMPVIQGGEQHIEPTKDNVFQILQGNITLEKELGMHLKEKGYTNPAVVYTNHDTMIRFKDAMVSGFGSPMKEFAINADEKDFRSHALKVSEGNPDVIVLLMFPEPGAQFVKQYSSTVGSLPQLAFDANIQSGIGDYQRILDGGKILDGSIVAIVASSLSAEFKESYKNRFGTDPGFFSDLGYDAVNVLVETYDADGEKWIDNVRDADLAGVGGPIAFDAVGVREPEVKIVQIIDGQIPAGE